MSAENASSPGIASFTRSFIAAAGSKFAGRDIFRPFSDRSRISADMARPEASNVASPLVGNRGSVRRSSYNSGMAAGANALSAGQGFHGPAMPKCYHARPGGPLRPRPARPPHGLPAAGSAAIVRGLSLQHFISEVCYDENGQRQV